MSARSSMWWATGAALVALLGSFTFWAILALASASSSFELTGFVVALIVFAGLGTVVNVAVAAVLAMPGISQAWAAHQRGMAELGAAGFGSLFVLYLPVIYILTILPLAALAEATTFGIFMAFMVLMAIVTIVAVPAGFAFALAAVSATRGRAAGGQQMAAA